MRFIDLNFSNEHCFFENVCYNLEGNENVLEISSEGYRENYDFPRRHKLLLNSCRDYLKAPVRLTNVKVFEEERKDKEKKVLYIDNPTLLYSRFVANNLMHVLHDDVFPLLLTISSLPELLDEVETGEARLLVTIDPHSALFFQDFYAWMGQFLNVRNIIDLVPNPQNISHVCFKKAVTGLNTDAQWYHYGMLKPQGPIDGIDRNRVGSNLRTLVDWMKYDKLKLATPSKPPKMITLLSRRGNRLILNELALQESLRTAFPSHEVKIISEEHTPLLEMISIVHNSSVLIGMHGALLSLALFLEPKAVLVELFPFGIPAEDYTPYKTLASLPELDIFYRSWTNPREESPDNVYHDSRHRFHGGLKHFPASYEAGIKATKTVPRHVCCYSPFWTFRIYQDTIVDSKAIIELIQSAQNQQ
jgi:protein O-mannose beta-1,4-N-acetylglucosaminyltransferase